MIEENMQEKVGNSIKEIFSSVKNHLEPSYRKQYNIRRFLSVVFLYFLIIAIMIEGSGNSYFSFRGIMVLIWCIVSWIFWHYAYWSFQGGIVHNFISSLFHFGTIGALIWRLIVQNFLVLMWISLIAPLSGIKTWLKAVKHDKILYIENQRHDVWN